EVTVQQKQLHVLGTFGEQLQFDLGVASCNALQNRTGQVWIEALQRAHRVERHSAQLRDAKRVLLGLVESAVRAQLRFDLVVSGQRLCLGGPQPARCLALGESEVL